MKKIIAILKKIDALTTAVLKYLTVALFLALTLIVTANVLLRIFPFTSLHWTDEIVELCFAGLVFYGAAGVWMAKGHFSVGDWFGKAVKNERARNLYRLFLELVALGFAAVLFRFSLNLTLRAQEVTSVFQIPKKVLYSCMPISSFIMTAYSLVFVIRWTILALRPGAFDEGRTEAGPREG
jgi:TRAP-type C4-dicarboxylate transport system permease small subunit